MVKTAHVVAGLDRPLVVGPGPHGPTGDGEVREEVGAAQGRHRLPRVREELHLARGGGLSPQGTVRSGEQRHGHRRRGPVVEGEPLVARSGFAHGAHEVDHHRRPVLDAGGVVADPVAEPVAQQRQRVNGGVVRVDQLARRDAEETVVGPRPHDQVLPAGRALAAVPLEGGPGLQGALLEDVVPAADVEDGHPHVAGAAEDVRLLPPGVEGPVLSDLVVELAEPEAVEPVEGIRLAHGAALEEAEVEHVGRRRGGEHAAQVGHRVGGHEVLGDGERGGSHRGDAPVAPALVEGPGQGGPPVIPVVAEDGAVAAAGSPESAEVLHDAVVADEVEGDAEPAHTVPPVGGAHQHHRAGTRQRDEVDVGGERGAVVGRDEGGEGLGPGGGRRRQGEEEEKEKRSRAFHRRPMVAGIALS